MASNPAVPFQLNPVQQGAVVSFVRNCVEQLQDTWNLRSQFLLRDRLYQREMDQSIEQFSALNANRAGDPYKYQNLQVPVILPQVESATAYLAGVFLTGYPMFGMVASPANVDAASMMENVVADNSIKFNWTSEFINSFRDGLKYNLTAQEVSWTRLRTYNLVNDPASMTKKPTETYYFGNKIRTLDMYNTIWDKRVKPQDVHTKGEFAGYTEIMSRIQLKQLLLDLDNNFTMNAKEAFESGSGITTLTGSDSWYYIPQVNPGSFIGLTKYPTTNWMQWVTGGENRQTINYSDVYEVTTLYGRIIPSDFRMTVPARNQPQIWKFIVVNRKVVIFAERQTNAHNYLPIVFGQPNNDGLAYQTKSFLDNVTPHQYMSSALWNAAIEAKRRQVFDRLLYDPSRVNKADIDKVSSVGRIPVRQSAYGKTLADAVYQIPFRDDNIADTLSMAERISMMADETNGQNKVDRGQFQKGNKTRAEFVGTMAGSSNRQQLMALAIEHGSLTPIKEMLKINILQYQRPTKLFDRNRKQITEIKPETFSELVAEFKVSDGLLPTDKLMSGELLQVFMQTLQTSPMMQAEFDIIGAFSYWVKQQGAQWFEDFKRTPEQKQEILNQQIALTQAEKAPPAQQPPQG